MTYPSTIESAGIGTTNASAFESAGIGLLNFIHSWPIPALLSTTYAGVFKSAGTGSKNAGIGYIHIFIKAVPTQVKTPEQGLQAPGPILALLKSAGTGPRDPIPTFKGQRFEVPGKKTPG